MNVSRTLIVLAILSFGISAGLSKDAVSSRFQGDLSHTHDGLIQTEYATQLLLQGRNIYSEDIPTTVLTDEHVQMNYHTGYGQGFHTINPALYHYAYPPLMFIQLVPFDWVSRHVLGFFDMRMVLLLYALLSLVLFVTLPAPALTKAWTGALLFLNPFYLHYLAQGRNDIMVFFWTLLMFVWLYQKKWTAAILTLAIACLLKQNSWFMVPFVYLYLYHRWGCPSDFIRRAVRVSLPGLIVAVLVIAPFALWDAQGLWTDLIRYQTGQLPTSYPVNGYGLLAILLKLGVITSPFNYYPTIWIQLPLYIAAFFFAHHRLKKSPTVATLIWTSTLGMFLFWFCGRYYNDSHVEFTLRLCVLGVVFRAMREKHDPA